MKKLLYLRSAPYQLNYKSYNLQEVGLAKAFCKHGYDCDIVYYSKENSDQVIKSENGKIRILWRNGIKILRSGIYPSILKKSFLDQYDVIIVSEYSQIMSVIVSHMTDKVYLYNGPYYNLFKIPFMQSVYDSIFAEYINKKMRKTFMKSELAKQFLDNKGITNSVVVGVGLDISVYEHENEITDTTQNLLNQMKDKKNLLYVGALSKRKNFKFLVEVFKLIKEREGYEDVQLVVIGKGNEKYVKSCLEVIDEKYRDSLIICSFIENAQLKYIYPEATIFLLPSVQEIFGMVLLEAMHFSVPIISSLNGGSGTLIESEVNGIIIPTFETQKWVDKISHLLEDNQRRKAIGKSAHKTVDEHYLWDSISEKMIYHMEEKD